LVPLKLEQTLDRSGKSQLFASSSLKFNAEVLYSRDNFHPFDMGSDKDYVYKLNPDGDVTDLTNSYNATFTMTNTFSSTAFLTVKASTFFRDYNEHLYDSPYDPDIFHLILYPIQLHMHS